MRFLPCIQVHRATTSDGRCVAVKVQHEGLRESSAADIATIEALVRVVKWAFPTFDYMWLVDETKLNLPKVHHVQSAMSVYSSMCCFITYIVCNGVHFTFVAAMCFAQELDFLHEAANAKRCAANLVSPRSRVQGKVVVPQVLLPLSSHRVLTMEFVHGVKVCCFGGFGNHTNKHMVTSV